MKIKLYIEVFKSSINSLNLQWTMLDSGQGDSGQVSSINLRVKRWRMSVGLDITKCIYIHEIY
jgi:hypothetical protein